MQKSVRHFVGKILGFHLLLLALALAVVTLAAEHVYRSAREQAMQQARAQQTLLAEQTAHGVQEFYTSILGDLDLLKPEDEEESDLPDADTPAPTRPLANISFGRQAIGAMLVYQLKDRAHLFMVDEQLRPHALGTEDRPLRGALGSRGGQRAAAPAPPPPTTGPSAVFEEDIISRYGDWLKTVNAPAIHGIQLIDERSIKLIALPLFTTMRQLGGTPGTRPVQRRSGWLVVAVAAKPVEARFLSNLNQYGVTGALLVDESMTVMAASNHKLVGGRIDQQASPELQAALASFAPGYDGTAALTAPFSIADQTFEPAMLSACPLKVMGNQWFVLVATPLKGVDQVVRDLSRKALLWAMFVALSVTAILVSTAAQLILSRLRMERMRHRSLQNEMQQARQIQLAWLPSKTKATCGNALVDIASLNRPATLISGDFYNFFDCPDGRTAVVIGDVTGHGTAAAFLMATTQLLIRNTLPLYCDPGRCLEEVNHQLTNQVFNGQFVTMQILLIDARKGEVEIATAGHPSPLVIDGDSFQPIKLEPQLVAGVDPTTKYATERFRIRPGASMLLYTDGVVDAEDPSGNRLRLDGLKKGVAGPIDSAEGLLQRAVSAVNTFRRGRDLRDDLTMVAVHLLPATEPSKPPTPRPEMAEAEVG